MIGKVIRGRDVKRLLYYLFGPGKANEHIDPHLVAAFGDPAELEPERRPGGGADVRRLAGLLNQPLAALKGPGYDKPVWHCAVRAAPGDRELTDEEWAQVAASIMDRTGLAPDGDDDGVRWVAVRHAADHVHLVATLARQDGTRPRIWNDFYRVREACRDAERRLGLAGTAPADCTAARRPSRAEAEQAIRRGQDEPPRTRLRREVCAAAAGAGTEREFFARLAESGVLVRRRYSTVNPDQVTGYAVGLPGHVAKDGGTVWFSGGKLAADLTLPKLRTRWEARGLRTGPLAAAVLPAKAAKGVLRATVARAATQSRDEAGFFARLRADGVLVRLRFSEVNPGQVTGYSVALPDHADGAGELVWYGGGRLAEQLSLPRLRRQWSGGGAARPGALERGAARFTGSERGAVLGHAARQVSVAAMHVRWCAAADPAGAADAAHAARDMLYIAARITRSPALRAAADAFDRAARVPYGRMPARSCEGSQLRSAARLLALAGPGADDTLGLVAALVASLVVLVAAVAELRQVQQHAAQAAAADLTLTRLKASTSQARVPASITTGRDPTRSMPDVRPLRITLPAATQGPVGRTQGEQPARPRRHPGPHAPPRQH